eukprot:1083416-Prymnesium_polylepis.1
MLLAGRSLPSTSTMSCPQAPHSGMAEVRSVGGGRSAVVGEVRSKCGRSAVDPKRNGRNLKSTYRGLNGRSGVPGRQVRARDRVFVATSRCYRMSVSGVA